MKERKKYVPLLRRTLGIVELNPFKTHYIIIINIFILGGEINSKTKAYWILLKTEPHLSFELKTQYINLLFKQ